jgi:hypothetical protein
MMVPSIRGKERKRRKVRGRKNPGNEIETSDLQKLIRREEEKTHGMNLTIRRRVKDITVTVNDRALDREKLIEPEDMTIVNNMLHILQ